MKRLRDILLIYIPTGFLLLSLSLVLAYRWLPVKWTPLMLVRTLQNIDSDDYVNRQNWVDINSVSNDLIEAILIAEDQRFYSHSGFDFAELARMQKDYDHYGKKLRGCSTISQQVAKNCFTFGSRTIARKALEAYYTILIELLWGKERILEVYLNVAETGRGLFGVEAACQKFYGTSANNVSADEAAALACVLPKPLARTPFSVMTTHTKKYQSIAGQIKTQVTATPEYSTDINQTIYKRNHK